MLFYNFNYFQIEDIIIVIQLLILVERDNIHNIKLKAGEIELKKVNTKEMEKAAETIQKYWRGYAARKRIEKYFNKMEEVLGMKISSVKNNSAMEKDQNNFRKRQELQEQALDRIEDTINRERIKVKKKMIIFRNLI